MYRHEYGREESWNGRGRPSQNKTPCQSRLFLGGYFVIIFEEENSCSIHIDIVSAGQCMA